MTPDTEYDVALSFAGEDREYVGQVVEELRRAGISVFYDKSEEVDLWGRDLAIALDNIYRKKSQFVVLFISKAYAKKAWTTFEKGSALAGAIARIGQDFILPARFDDTDIPGVNPNIAYIELRNHTPLSFAELLVDKVHSHGTRAVCSEEISLESLLVGYIQQSPFRQQDEVLKTLNLEDWPETVSFSMFTNAPKPTRADKLKVTAFKTDVLFRVVVSTQAERHFTFKLLSRPSQELRTKNLTATDSQKHFTPVAFDVTDHQDEYCTGNLAYDLCDACEGAGTVTEVCRVCAGKGTLELPLQVRCHKCKRGNTIAICRRCGGTGYLDVFPFTGRRVFRKDHVLMQGIQGGDSDAKVSLAKYQVAWEDSIRKALPDQVPFAQCDPALAERYASVLAAERRSDTTPEESVSHVQDDPFMEKRQISPYKTYFNGCQFRVEVCKRYHIAYTRTVSHTKGFFKKETVTTRIAGSFVVIDNGKLVKIGDTHHEKAMD